MAATAEERIPALTSADIFSLAVPFAAIASERRIGANAAGGQKTHQGIFSTNRAVCVSASRAKWPGTHQVSGQWWSETVLGIVLDANGNTLSDPSGKSYTWDFENRMTQAVVPGTNGGTTTFKYDPFGRRIYKQSPNFTSVFLYDGPTLIETVNASGIEVASYTQGLNIDEPLAMLRGTTTDYYAADGLGSITSLTSSAGAVADTYTYDSFGNVTTSTGTLRNPFLYAGREYDNETSLYFNRARYYDAASGRFRSEDPIRFSGGADFYAYVFNNPAILTDPRGLCPSSPQSCEEQLASIVSDTNAMRSGGTSGFKGLAQRFTQILTGNYANPGHADQYLQRQRNLQKKIQDYIDSGCGDPPALVTQWATQPLASPWAPPNLQNASIPSWVVPAAAVTGVAACAILVPGCLEIEIGVGAAF
jgi:RHS repeat-associated protein